MPQPETKFVFGETEEIRAHFDARRNQSFTISSAAITIRKPDGTATRDGVPVTDISGSEAWLLETFSAANGYAEDTVYSYTIAAAMAGGQVSKHDGKFLVTSATDA